MAMWRTLIRKFNRKTVCVLVGYLALVYVGTIIPQRLSVSPTDSVGAHVFLYKKHFRSSDLHKGSLVVVPLYTKLRPKCWPCLVVKYIKCEAGDTLEVKNHGEFFCNHVFLGSAKTHSKEGIPVKAFEYNGIIPRDKFFAMGSSIDSYDSRYVGFEDKNDIKAVALPIF